MQKWTKIGKFFKLKPLKISYAVENYVVRFGVYKNSRLQDVEDLEYLHWFKDTAGSSLDKKIVSAFLEAEKKYGHKFPDHFHRKQFTKWIMAQREKDTVTRRDHQHDQLIINEH